MASHSVQRLQQSARMSQTYRHTHGRTTYATVATAGSMPHKHLCCKYNTARSRVLKRWTNLVQDRQHRSRSRNITANYLRTI